MKFQVSLILRVLAFCGLSQEQSVFLRRKLMCLLAFSALLKEAQETEKWEHNCEKVTYDESNPQCQVT